MNNNTINTILQFNIKKICIEYSVMSYYIKNAVFREVYSSLSRI